MIVDSFRDNITGAFIVEAKAVVAGLPMTFREAVGLPDQLRMSDAELEEHLIALRDRCCRKIQEIIDAHNSGRKHGEPT